MDRNPLGNTEARAADDAGDIGAVAVAVVRTVAVTDEIDGAGRPPAEVRMRGANTGIDDIGVYAGARLAVAIDAVQRRQASVNAIDTGRRRAGRIGRLLCVAGAELIRFDVVDARQRAQCLQTLRRNLDAKTVERRSVDVHDFAANPRDALPKISHCLACHAWFHDDDVTVGESAAHALISQWSKLGLGAGGACDAKCRKGNENGAHHSCGSSISNVVVQDQYGAHETAEMGS